MQDTQVLIATIGQLSYVGLFILFLLVNAAMPIPEEVFLIILGYTIGLGIFNVFISAPLAFAGLLISDIVIHSLVKSQNKYIVRARNRFIKGFTEKDIDFIRKHIKKAIFFPRFLMGLRFIGPVFSGVLHIKTKKFIIFDSLALIIFVPTLIFLGYFFQNKISLLVKNAGVIHDYIFIVLIFVIFILFSGKFRKLLFSIMRKFIRHKEINEKIEDEIKVER